MNLFSLGVEDENILVRGPIKSMKIEPTQILMIPQYRKYSVYMDKVTCINLCENVNESTAVGTGETEGL